VNVDRAVRPLGALLRLLLAGVIATAFAVDSTLAFRYRFGLERRRLGSWPFDGSGRMLLIAGVAAAGIAWTMWPRYARQWALSATAASLLATLASTRGYLPFAIFTELVVLPVLFGALLASRSHWRWPVAGIVALAAAATALRGWGEPVRSVVALTMLVLLGAAVTAVVYMRLRDRERAMSIERARHAERLDLARELHDVVGHHVTGMVVLAQAKRFTAGRGGADDGTLAEIERAGLETLTSIRRLVGMLRADPATTAGPQLADIERIVADLRRTHQHLELHVDAELRTRWVPDELASTVQRLVQETATNIRRHGDPARPASIALGLATGEFTLVATNSPFHAARTNGGYGLVGMRERVESLGGAFAAGFDGSGHWVVSCRLPLAATVPV
jgi:signal transduction histidine kinase